MIGVSGTCYTGSGHNSYFSDVINRYSLREAIESGYIKHLEYLDYTNLPNKNNQKWEVIYNSHNEIKSSLESLVI
jgi:type III restriction enzyme